MKKLHCLILLILLPGCSAVMPHESQNSQMLKANLQAQNNQAMAVTKQVEMPSPPIDVKVEGTNNTVSITPPATPAREKVTAQSNNTAMDTGNEQDAIKSSVSIPLFVKLIGLFFAISMLFGLVGGTIWYLRKNSAAADAAYKVADAALAAQIQKHTSLATVSTDAATIANHTSTIADLQAARVTLAKQ